MIALVAIGGMARIGLPSLSAQNYPAVYAFGSEMSATRGGPYAQGRWCNGPVWIEHLSDRFGILYNPDHNRAEGGANSIRILNQVTALPPPGNAGTALFVVMPGILDLGSNAESAMNVSFWQVLVNQLMANTATAVERLYQKGARRIVLVNAPDLAKFPQTATLDASTRSALRVRIHEHNLALRLQAQNSASAFPALTVRVADFFCTFDVIFEHATEFGFSQTQIAAWHDDELTDKTFDGPGSRYLFWDNVHPSSAFHALLAQSIATELAVPRLTLAWQSGGPVVTFHDLRLGRDYCLEQSLDLESWTELDCFQAVDFNRSHAPASHEVSWSFYRLVLPP
jgi:thermolabile hemolysin